MGLEFDYLVKANKLQEASTHLIAPMACMNVLVLVREDGKPVDVDFSLLREERR